MAETPDSDKTERLVIRSTKETKTEFKEIAAHFDDFEDALQEIMKIYKEYQRTKVKGGVF